MARRKPEQCPDTVLSFNDKLISYLDAKGHNDAWLARKSGLSKATISRMIQNRDYRGKYYRPREESLIAVCLALGLTAEQRWELYYLAFPERAIYTEAMNNGYSVHDTNVILEGNNLPALTDE